MSSIVGVGWSVLECAVVFCRVLCWPCLCFMPLFLWWKYCILSWGSTEAALSAYCSVFECAVAFVVVFTISGFVLRTPSYLHFMTVIQLSSGKSLGSSWRKLTLQLVVRTAGLIPWCSFCGARRVQAAGSAVAFKSLRDLGVTIVACLSQTD